MKTKNAIQHISSDKIQFNLPASWEALTGEQFRYICFLRCGQFTAEQIATYCLVRFLGIKVHKYTDIGWGCSIRKGWKRKKFFLKNWEIQFFLKFLSFLEDPGQSVMNLSKIGNSTAVDKYLHGVSFSDYLQAENYYQGYLYTQDEQMLKKLATVLYLDKKGNRIRKIQFSQVELYSVFQWYYSLKYHFSQKFPSFFQRVDSSGENDNPEIPDMEAIMNSEIRALTGGDITKEKEILEMDTWRALTELNEKAREIKELEDKR